MTTATEPQSQTLSSSVPVADRSTSTPYPLRKLFLLCAALLLTIALVTIAVDPLFHYHAPVSKLTYRLKDQRYQNDGLLRHSDYDALLLGTSMTENFDLEQFRQLFSPRGLRISYSGASFRELAQAKDQAFRHQPDLKLVVQALDLNYLFQDSAYMSDFDYPTYLYDDQLWNDYHYWWNRSIFMDYLLVDLMDSLLGRPSDSVAKFGNWSAYAVPGKASVLAHYKRPAQVAQPQSLSAEEELKLRQNIRDNVKRIAQEQPDAQFSYFVPPYSIVWWDEQKRAGLLEKRLAGQRLLVEELQDLPNVKVFLFNDATELYTNLDLYKDPGHYMPAVNAYLLEAMAMGKHLVSRENADDYFAQSKAFLETYDYDEIFKAN